MSRKKKSTIEEGSQAEYWTSFGRITKTVAQTATATHAIHSQFTSIPRPATSTYIGWWASQERHDIARARILLLILGQILWRTLYIVTPRGMDIFDDVLVYGDIYDEVLSLRAHGNYNHTASPMFQA